MITRLFLFQGGINNKGEQYSIMTPQCSEVSAGLMHMKAAKRGT